MKSAINYFDYATKPILILKTTIKYTTINTKR